jgi:glutamate synthase (NADPH/NADH) small chain
MPSPAWKQKHNWLYVSRTLPPKRPAKERARDFCEIDFLFDAKTIREQASRCLQCPHPLCVTGCPLQNRIPEWLGLAAEGKFLEAAAVSQATSNMPELCSRVCPQERLCEGACILNSRSEPVTIGAIEKFINEYAFANDAIEAAPVAPNGFRVAVVGSGPGGLACADELAKLGYAVVVFEAQPIPGGLLVNGIPAFKLDKKIVERRINVYKKRGVEFRLNVRVGVDISMSALREKFDAIFLGVGAQKPKALDIPGAELKGVFDALPFLIQKNVGQQPFPPAIDVRGKNVVVLGGGDTAMDCLRTSLRCGAREAVCVYRRDFENMPGSRKEYFNALDEGAKFQFLTNPLRLEENAAGELVAVKCVRMELGEPDANGRRKPRAVPGSETTIPADLVLIAYGFDAVPLIEIGLRDVKATEWETAVVDGNQMTSVPGIFAGGDIVRGPSLAVHAVKDGRKAAAAIHAQLAQGKWRRHHDPERSKKSDFSRKGLVLNILSLANRHSG